MTVRWFRSRPDGKTEETSVAFVPADALRRLMLVRNPGLTDDDFWIDGWRYWIYITYDSPLNTAGAGERRARQS